MGVHAKIETSPGSINEPANGIGVKHDDASKQRIEALLQLEAEVRKCTSIKQLRFLIVNETANLIPSRQTILMHGDKTLSIIAISSLATLDKTSPSLRWLQTELRTRALSADERSSEQPDAPLVGFSELEGASAPNSQWPFCKILQVQLRMKSNAGTAKLVLLSERSFGQADLVMAQRLSDTYSHAWNALIRTPIRFAGLLTKKTGLLISFLCMAAMFIPVKMSVLAPVEIVARDPIVVAAPLTGVVGSVSVHPNARVSAGDLLFSYTSTDLENEFKIAQQSVQVAKSKYLRASQDAFGTGVGRREMAELKSEMILSTTKLEYAKSKVERSRVRASGEGVILFSDKEDWIGKPVSTGEKIMRIANPKSIEFLINLPIADSIILEDGDEVRIFLDVDPLNPVDANIIRRSYQAKSDEMNNFSFELIARPSSNGTPATGIANRIGVRGTGQIFGKKVSLGLYLFRKPLSVFRQFTGL